MSLPASLIPLIEAVIEVLRRDVQKPVLPVVFPRHWDVELRAEIPTYQGPRFLGTDHKVLTPLGLHPKSTTRQPAAAREFAAAECSEEAVAAFLAWWSSLATAEEATRAIDTIWK